MRIRAVGILLFFCLLLTGCAPLLNREYSVVELHSSKFWESDAGDTLRAESYQDVVNDFLLLVNEHTEQAAMRLYDESSELVVANLLERAAAEVQQETPLGAYAVEYITTESQPQRGYYEVTVRIGYRRTKEQVKAIVNATSTAALPDMLNAAMESGRRELAVRIGYWDEEDPMRVAETLAAVEEEWELTGSLRWVEAYYPNAEEAGLIEFCLETVPEPPKTDEGTEPGDGTQTGGETGEGAKTGGKTGDGTEIGGETGDGTGTEGEAEPVPGEEDGTGEADAPAGTEPTAGSTDAEGSPSAASSEAPAGGS